MSRLPIGLLGLGMGCLLLASALLAVPSPAAAQADPLRARLEDLGVTPLQAPPASPPAQIALGQALFFDKLLSGNRDIACATCHHPLFASGDARSLSLGTGHSGLGPLRETVPGRMFTARNANDLFNRGVSEWAVMFWDGRVLARGDGTFVTPAGDVLPDGVESVLAAQALVPGTAPAEMRGLPGDLDVFGAENELALFDDTDYPAIWAALLARIVAVPGYVDLLGAAYPDVPVDQIGIQHVANAIGAFEADAFYFADSPFERYLRGDDGALSDNARAGANLFFGDAGCWRCHSGPLLSDQRFHNVAAPQIGPGKPEEAPFDDGRARVTGDPAERFAFRTPSLHNVTLTGPWFHNGAYTILRDAVGHMIAPVELAARLRWDGSGRGAARRIPVERSAHDRRGAVHARSAGGQPGAAGRRRRGRPAGLPGKPDRSGGE